MGMAPVAHVLFSRFMNANPKNSSWLNRDRFVLSNGHGCALQYILLHLLGYKVKMDDLKAVSWRSQSGTPCRDSRDRVLRTSSREHGCCSCALS